MSIESELPQRWAERLIARGFTDRRGSEQRPSLGALSDVTGSHVSTLKAAITGSRKPSTETVERLVAALGADVADWLGVARPRDWTPPANASLLTDRQRKAIEELINSMTERQEQHRGNTAPTNPAGESPAQVKDLRPKVEQEYVPKPPTAEELAGDGDSIDNLAADRDQNGSRGDR